MKSSSTLATVLTLSTWFINPIQAVTDCSEYPDSCICVWNVTIPTIRGLNGVYRKVDPATALTHREWVKDPLPTSLCSLADTKYFWYLESNGRWFLGDDNEKDTSTGDCWCNDYPLFDPLESSCSESLYYCEGQIVLTRVRYNDSEPELQDLYIEFGLCPDVTQYCQTIGVTADTNTECDGIYDAIAPLNDLDNQRNMYQNQDTAANATYIYFDESQLWWVCQSGYVPCGTKPAETIYKGAQDDFGTPDFSTIRNTGETWTVAIFATSDTVTFECNPPTPTSAPTTAVPTSVTSPPTKQPSDAPSKYPTKYPTQYPSQYPTKYPSTYPTEYPTKYPSSDTTNPTETPSQTPNNDPTKGPTGYPSTIPTKYPSDIPSLFPTTRGPTEVGATRSPSGYPTGNPSPSPTDVTVTPTQSPLDGDATHSPVTAMPTNQPSRAPTLPTPHPTTITFQPGASPATQNPSSSPVKTVNRHDGEKASSDNVFVVVPSVVTSALSLYLVLIFV